MDAVDNPSYFTLPSEARRKKAGFSFLRMRSDSTTGGKQQHQQQLTQSGSVAGIASLSSSTSNRRAHAGKTLSRSLSEDTHLLVLGKPRPTDMAPSVYSAANNIHHHFHHHRNARSATMPRHVLSSEGLLHQDMILCGAVPSSAAAENDENDVFLTNDNASKFINHKYYNVTTGRSNAAAATLPGHWLSSSVGSHRRHSVGSVLQRTNSTSGNTTGTTTISIRPNVDDSTTTGRVTDFRRRCNKLLSDNKATSLKSADAEDILIVSSIKSEAASLWVKYLISCFQQICKEQNRSPFRISKVHLENLLSDGSVTSSDLETYSSARLQIVIVCPQFLQETQRWPIQQEIPLGKIIHSDRVIAMLLGVSETSVTIQLKPTVNSYDNWRRMIVKDQDPTFVGDFLGIGMDILSRSWHLREALGNSVEQTDAMFSILPKKVKVGQNKLIALLTEPLSSDDAVKVFIDKNGNLSEIANVKRRNPYTLQFSAPMSCLHVSALVNVQIEKNNKSLGRRLIKCESRMRELDQLLRSVDTPMQFMCQSFNLNVGDREQLDNILLNSFQRNTPPNFNLLQPLPNKYQICNEEYPTLLHFSAKHGLEKLSWQLLEIPGGEQACQLRNSSQLIPSEMAEKAGHSKLAAALKGYMQMTELSSVYNYLKGLDDKAEKCKTEPMEIVNSIQDDIYLLPKLLNDTYQIPPAARPVSWKVGNNVGANGNVITNNTGSANLSGSYYANFKPCNFTMPSAPNRSCSETFLHDQGNYQVPRNGRPCAPQTARSPTSPGPRTKLGAYMDMTCSGSEIDTNFGSCGTFNTSDFQDNFGSFGKLDSCESAAYSTDSNTLPDYRTNNRTPSKEKLSPDEELLEIIHDFKNNVFTITEVEQLVQSWQNRNDVQQSFREKQEQLNKMREEYDKIQRKIKEQMKRPTPFEKIRRFFGKSKSKHSESSSRTSVSSDTSTNTSNYRPPSSISLQSTSSGSSGRNSVTSGNSIYYDSNHHHASDIKTDLYEKSGDNNKSKPTSSMIPQPPRYLNLSASYDECSSSDYSPVDYSSCRSSSSAATTPSDGKIICQEGMEIDNALRILRTIDTLDNEKSTAIGKKNQTKINRYYSVQGRNDVNDKLNNNSKCKNKKFAVNKKAKSEENLLSNHRSYYANVSIPSSEDNSSSRCDKQDAGSGGGKVLKNSNSSPKLNETCRTLCNESIKCLADITINLAVEEEEERTSLQSGDEFSFKCENALNAVGKRLCVANDDLDRSSFSLNSTGGGSTTDESRTDEKSTSCELNKTETEYKHQVVDGNSSSSSNNDSEAALPSCLEPEIKEITEMMQTVSSSSGCPLASCVSRNHVKKDQLLFDDTCCNKFPEYVNIAAPASTPTASTTAYKYGTVTM